MRRRRRNAAVCRSQRRTSHDRAAVSGGEGDCKESTHQPAALAPETVRVGPAEPVPLERSFPPPYQCSELWRYRRSDNDLRAQSARRSGPLPMSITGIRGALRSGFDGRSPTVDSPTLCRGCATADDAGHHRRRGGATPGCWSVPQYGVLRPPMRRLNSSAADRRRSPTPRLAFTDPAISSMSQPAPQIMSRARRCQVSRLKSGGSQFAR